MISSIEFKQKWNELEAVQLKPIPISKLKPFDLNALTIDFLTHSGLPDGAAPFLSFFQGTPVGRGEIQLITNIYSSLGAEFDRYIYIGYCDDADPIVLNTAENDQIEILARHNDFSSSFLNSSISSLAECILIYRDFIRLNMEENGHGNNFTDTQFDNLQQKIAIADPRASVEGFWKESLKVDWAMREEYRKVRLYAK
jgi:hypothetical protein